MTKLPAARCMIYRFGDFDFDTVALKLHRGGQLVALERRPGELLSLLVEEAGRLVPRDRIVERLWGAHIHVEAELGINTAIRKLRRALGDRPEAPCFIETIPRQGYRFIASVAAVPTPEPSRRIVVVVLPFDDLSQGVHETYLADGFTEETVTRLGQIDPAHLTVIGRTSVAALRRAGRNPSEIAETFGADFLVESSLRVERGRLRVVSKLIDAREQRQVWAETYDGEPSRILAFQESLSRTIAMQIRLQLSPHTPARHSANPAALDFFLRGRYLWNQNSRQTNEQAIGLYRQAIALDPDYALAWSGIAETLAASPVNGDVAPALVMTSARDAARRAVEAGPDLAEPHAARGFTRFWLEWEWSLAEADFRRAIMLNPSYAFAHRMLAVVLSHAGMHQEAREAIRTACELDPLFAMHHALASQVAFQARDFPAAAEHARHAMVVGPNFWIGHHMLAQTLERLGDDEGMFVAAQVALNLSGRNAKTLAVLGYALAKLGRDAEARAILAECEATGSYVPPVAAALVHAALGETDAAFEALERAIAVRDVNLAFLTQDPKWDALRTDHRFLSVIERCGFMAVPSLHSAAIPSSAARHTGAA